MRKIIWTITSIALLAAVPAANAKDTSKEETVGFGAGGTIGAVAGGPIGFIIGAAIGAKIGDSMDNKDTEIDTLTASLDESRETIGNLEFDIDTISSELEQVERFARPELVDLMQAGIAMDLLFRTDEHVLADSTGGRLRELAQTVAAMPDIRVKLDGFADERGDADYNQALSQKRVEFVRDQLISAGIDPARIRYVAHGEAPAQDDSVDSFALERRVSLTLFIEDMPAVASNPD